MAMNGNTLGSAIVTAVNALSPTQKVDPTACWQAIAGAIVHHIQTSAVVLVTPSDNGLQTDSAGHATTGPSAVVTLPAGCIG